MPAAKDQRTNPKERVEERQGLILHEEAQQRQPKEEREKDDPAGNGQPTWHVQGEDRGFGSLGPAEKSPTKQSTDSKGENLQGGNWPQEDRNRSHDGNGGAWTIRAQRCRHAPDRLRHHRDGDDQQSMQPSSLCDAVYSRGSVGKEGERDGGGQRKTEPRGQPSPQSCTGDA